MTGNEVREALRQKIELRWSEYKAGILQCSTLEIFDHAEEIAAAKFCHDRLTADISGYKEDCLEYLLRFADPLAVVRDQRLAVHEFDCLDIDDEFGQTLWMIQNTQDAEQDYPLDPDWMPRQDGPSMC